MRGFNPKVDVRASQLDEFKEHIRRNQFVYGILAGIVIANLLRNSQTINITIPREKY